MKQQDFEAVDKILRDNGRADLAEKLCTFANQVAEVLTYINSKSTDAEAQGEFQTSGKKKIIEHKVSHDDSNSISVHPARGAVFATPARASKAWDNDEAFVVNGGDNHGQIFCRSNIATLKGKPITDVLIGTSSGKFLLRVKVR